MFSAPARFLLTAGVVCAGAVGAAATQATADSSTDSFTGSFTGSLGGGGWSPPVELASQGSAADVAVAPNGDMTVAVLDGGDVLLVQRPAGGDWGSPVVVGGGGSAETAQVESSTDSQLVVAWTESGSRTRVLTRSSLAGGGWSDTEVVARRTGGVFTGLQLVVNGQDETALGWLWSGAPAPARSRLLVTGRTAGGDWSPPARFDGAVVFDLALGDSGMTAVVMSTLAGHTERVLAARRPEGGAFGPARVLATLPDVTFLTGWGDVAVDGTGTTTATWRDQSGEGAWQVLAARAQPGRAFGRAAVLAAHAGFVYESPPEALASVAGTTLVIWSQANGALMSSRHPQTGRWTSPGTLRPKGEGQVLIWDAAMEPSGRAAVVWTVNGWFGNPGEGVAARVMNRQGVWNAVADVTRPHAPVYDPFAGIGHGDAIAVWHQVVGGGLPVRASMRLAP